MNWIDFILLILLLVSIVKGAMMGAVKRIIQIAAVLIALAECWRLAPFLRDVVFPNFGMSGSSFSFLIPIVSFVLIYLLVRSVGGWIASVLEGGALGVINHIVGGILGLVIGIYALGYVLTAIDFVLPSEAWLEKRGVTDSRSESHLYKPFKHSIVDLAGIEEYIKGGGEEETGTTP